LAADLRWRLTAHLDFSFQPSIKREQIENHYR
jgi:hypothetical protein